MAVPWKGVHSTWGMSVNGTCDFGLVTDASAGEWIPPEDASALAQAVFEWRDNPSNVAKYAKNSEYAAQQHSRDRLAIEMLNILREISLSAGRNP